MLRCNLSIILAEKNLKITKVSNDTGISRTTLTALCNNTSQGIQFDTLNTLCSYLNVKPNELIHHIPIELKILNASINGFVPNDDIFWNDEPITIDNYCLLEIQLIQNHQSFQYQLKCPVLMGSEFSSIPNSITLIIERPKINEITPTTYLFDLLEQIPRPFLTDIEELIIDKLFDFYIGFAERKLFSITWNIGK